MFNKDQYNQEEYNDYYQQEVEGAELGSSHSKKNKFIGKLIALLSLLALAIASYFGYKAFSNSASINDNNHTTNISAKASNPALPKSVQEKSTSPITNPEATVPVKEDEPKETIDKEETSSIAQKEMIKERTTTEKLIEKNSSNTQSEVSKVVKSQAKMSPEEVAAVVAAVMKQMSQTKSTTNNNTVERPNKQDLNLMNKLTDLEVDSVSKDLMDELGKAEVNEDAKIENSDKKIDVYNKVNVQNSTSKMETDTLSKLSDEINSIITKEATSETSSTSSTNTNKSYRESLKSEVSVRKNEMRIIVVREGDTLGKIAKRAYGDAREFKRIYEANPEVTRPDRIYVGQKLRIPN